jgi:hypothetical protein
MLKALLLMTTWATVHAPPLEPGLSKARYAAIQAGLEAEMAASYRREAWSWVPVYGAFVALREQSRLEALADLRARAETLRIEAR